MRLANMQPSANRGTPALLVVGFLTDQRQTCLGCHKERGVPALVGTLETHRRPGIYFEQLYCTREFRRNCRAAQTACCAPLSMAG